jgi:gliding motility-associated-like protein
MRFIPLTFFFIFLLSSSQSFASLVIQCPGDKNEAYAFGCKYTLPDYSSEVVVLESSGQVFITQNPSAGTDITETTTIQIIATDESGNIVTCSFVVNLPNLPSLSFGTVSPYCFNGTDGIINVVPTGGTAPYSYLWSNGATTPVVSNLSSGNYTLTVTDAVGCTVSGSATIPQPSQVNLAYTVSTFTGGHNVSSKEAEDGWIQASASGGQPPYAWLWSTGESTSAISNLGVGTYWVVVTDFNGCVDTATIVLMPPFFIQIPVAISPNGDGLNDFFVIDGLEDYPENKLVIFNRWGDIVWERENYKNDWNGESEAPLQVGKKELPDGTYFYHLRIKDQVSVFKGSVVLKRK